MLAEKERHITESGDPRRAALLSLADERGRLNAELAEMNQAMQAAASARQALSVVEDRLGSASGWNTYDTFFGGGMLVTAVPPWNTHGSTMPLRPPPRPTAAWRCSGLTSPNLTRSLRLPR